MGKKDPTGRDRTRPRGTGQALAGTSTPDRLGLTPVRANAHGRSEKIVGHLGATRAFLVEAFARRHLVPPTRIVLDPGSTDVVPRGHQLGRFSHGDHDASRYPPLHIFRGDHPPLAPPRPPGIDNTAGALKHRARAVARLRAAWPRVTTLARGDGGFCRERLTHWREAQGVDYLFGPAGSKRSRAALAPGMAYAEGRFARTRQPARASKDFG